MTTPTLIKGHVTIIGSRRTPDTVLTLMEALGAHLADSGWWIRSGHAEGADLAGERGVLRSNAPQAMEIYLPWASFGVEREGHPDCYWDVRQFDNYPAALEIAESIHPAWDKCKQGARALHARNPYQVLGRDLSTPSQIVFCYAKPLDNQRVEGGTGTAVLLARQHRIPVVNLYHLSARETALKYMG